MQAFRLENFIAAPSNLRKREVATLEVRYDPRNLKQIRRIRTMRDRAVELGVDYKISRDGDVLKISLSGYKGAVKRVLNPAYRSSTRRSSHKKASSTRRRSQRGGGLFDFWKKDSAAPAKTPVADGTSAKRGFFSTLFGIGKNPAAPPADDVPEPAPAPVGASVGGARRSRHRHRRSSRHQSRRR